MSRVFKLALAQMHVTSCKATNLERAAATIGKAAQSGAKMVALPECFNSPYGTQFFAEYAEPIPGKTTEMLSLAARQHKVYVVGGSFPEKDGDALYNTCTVFDPEGTMIAKHRKIHLFDIDVPGKMTFKESETLSPGKDLTVVRTPLCTFGIGICYDIRFPELAQIYASKGCELLLYPSAFNMTTGPAHWELLQRSRALDNQLYVATSSPARDTSARYVAWGHSTCVGPWGDVLAKAGEGEELVTVDIDLARVDEVRQSIPIRTQRRSDLYELKEC